MGERALIHIAETALNIGRTPGVSGPPAASSATANLPSHGTTQTEEPLMAIIDFFDRGCRISPAGIAYVRDDLSYTFQEAGELSWRTQTHRWPTDSRRRPTVRCGPATTSGLTDD